MSDGENNVFPLPKTNGHVPHDHAHDALTDLANAQRLIADHGPTLKHIHPWNRWLHYTQGRWADDNTGHADQLAKQTIRALLSEAILIEDAKVRARRLKDIISSERAGRIRGMLELARSEPGIPAQPQDLDTDPWLLNIANGTLDLRTGELRQHNPDELITKQAPAQHDPKAACPTWDAFLQRILPEPQTRLFLQRAAGYTLVGGNPAQIMLILHGSGANGKSTFIETTLHLFGDYGQQAPPETFLTKRDGIPNDVARLRGARFVSAVEIAEGRRLNEPLIKRMTGGDTMTARFMRSEYFEFQPQFTPWLATNHKPEIKGTDEGIWRRIRLIPFDQTIPDNEQDGDLKPKLRNELPGILNWAIEGCLAWQHDGLGEPEAVRAATAAYRNDQDIIGGFIDDHCHLNTNATTLTGDLYRAYTDWARSSGTEAISAKAFGQKLTERGFEAGRTRHGRYWAGIALETDQEHLSGL